MKQYEVENIRNTMTTEEISQAMLENRKRRGNAYCETCDRWWYGIGRKRCETHNPHRRDRQQGTE